MVLLINGNKLELPTYDLEGELGDLGIDPDTTFTVKLLDHDVPMDIDDLEKDIAKLKTYSDLEDLNAFLKDLEYCTQKTDDATLQAAWEVYTEVYVHAPTLANTHRFLNFDFRDCILLKNCKTLEEFGKELVAMGYYYVPHSMDIRYVNYQKIAEDELENCWYATKYGYLYFDF
jgi:hypothetical protein